MKLAFTASARREVYEITRFYASEDRRLAVSFVEELDRVLALLLDSPMPGRPVSRRTRQISLRKQPYSVYYSLDEARDLIAVSVVCHQRRDPGYAQGRVREPTAGYALSAIPAHSESVGFFAAQ